MGTELTVAALAGIIAPWLTALLTQVELRPSYKRLIAIAVTLLLVGVGIFATYQPATTGNRRSNRRRFGCDAGRVHGDETRFGRGRVEDQSW